MVTDKISLSLPLNRSSISHIHKCARIMPDIQKWIFGILFLSVIKLAFNHLQEVCLSYENRIMQVFVYQAVRENFSCIYGIASVTLQK